MLKLGYLSQNEVWKSLSTALFSVVVINKSVLSCTIGLEHNLKEKFYSEQINIREYSQKY